MVNERRTYRMRVAGQMFNQLGLQMYSGAVPSITELISNAYDAMARNVWIDIPIGRSVKPTDKVVVRDDGHGMNYKECNDLYLLVGRDRRKGRTGLTKRYNGLKPRKVQGRKGIGKLAGFGIAHLIEVKTIQGGSVSHFRLDFNDLTKSPDFADTDGYEPEPLKEDGNSTKESPMTEITLSKLKITRAITESNFRASIARRLLVLDDNFTVHVNGIAITREEVPFQFRFPKTKWQSEQLSSGEKFQWWVGFCEQPIDIEEQRGFVVYVRGKLAQTPWFFDISGGTWGQHGLQYLTGEIKADFLDEKEDLIATDRGTVRWEDPMASLLKEWGQKKIKDLLQEWAKKRREDKKQNPIISKYLTIAKHLPQREREIFESAVDRICSIPQIDKGKNSDITDELVVFIYNALTNKSLLDMIHRINISSPEDMKAFTQTLSEWDIIEAINTAQVVKGRVQIIQTFEQMIDNKVREKPDMQEYLKQHPWLIDPKWSLLAHEKALDTIISKHYGLQKTKTHDGRQRLDFFCLGDRSSRAYVVEVKKPGNSIGKEELRKLQDYVLFLREQQKNSEDSYDVSGLLIADGIKKGHEEYLKDLEKTVTYRNWQGLLRTTKTLHEEFLTMVTERAPKNDPRMSELMNRFPEKDEK